MDHYEALPDVLRRSLDGADPPESHGWRLLDMICGDRCMVLSLDDASWPDEPFSWTAIDDNVRPRVTEVLDATDAFCDRHLDTEWRTVMRRLLARAALYAPSWFTPRRKASRQAAALVWLSMSGNLALKRRTYGWVGSDIWELFGVSSASGLGLELAEQLNMVDDGYGDLRYQYGTDVALGDIGLLHSFARRNLVQRRELARTLDEQVAERAAASQPIRHLGGGHFEIRGRAVGSPDALKGLTDEGRAQVLVAFDSEPPGFGSDLLAMSIPDARMLIRAIQRALDAPMPAFG